MTVDPINRLVIPADLNEIPQLSAAIEESMLACGFSAEAILDMQLAVEESVVNTILHGYHGAKGEVAISLKATQDSIQVQIEDCAPPFDPLSLPDPDRRSDLAEREIGGLGIFLIRQVMDEVRYRYSKGRNILTLKKRKAVDTR